MIWPSPLADRLGHCFLALKNALQVVAIDLGLGDVGDRHLLLIEDHGAEKVNRRVLATLEVLGELPTDVFPQRRPVIGDVPDVLALEQRNLELETSFEEGEERGSVGFHGAFRGLGLGLGRRVGRWSFIVGRHRGCRTRCDEQLLRRARGREVHAVQTLAVVRTLERRADATRRQIQRLGEAQEHEIIIARIGHAQGSELRGECLVAGGLGLGFRDSGRRGCLPSTTLERGEVRDFAGFEAGVVESRAVVLLVQRGLDHGRRNPRIDAQASSVVVDEGELAEELGDAALQRGDAAILVADDLVEIVVGLAAKRGLDLELGDAVLELLDALGARGLAGLAHAVIVRDCA